jgi:hypothetical protein
VQFWADEVVRFAELFPVEGDRECAVLREGDNYTLDQSEVDRQSARVSV